jgi:acyl-lipid omega-6 desaturase (Delta-12 desaturase)
MSSSAESVYPTASSPAAAQEQHFWRRATARYRASRTKDGVVQLCTTLLPLAALFWVMHWSLGYSYWLTLALAVPTAGFLIRTFIIMHDCGHGSFVPSRRANDVIGFITGTLVLTPYAAWRRDHAIHHASAGDLDRRGTGDVMTLTLDEYAARTRWGRMKYRMYRSPLVLFGFGPLYLVVIRRLRVLAGASEPKATASVRATDAALLAAVVVLSFVVGLKAVLLIYLPTFLIAGAVGNWLFYVQHQFEDTYWQPHSGWDYTTAALRGSSYYRLPRVLEWMTGSIGLHHVHHIDPKVPNYNLRRCHEDNPEFHDVTVLTLRESFRTASLKLWDAERGRLVGFDAATSSPPSSPLPRASTR